MVSKKIYPTYDDNYYYYQGDSFITLKRTRNVYGGDVIYQHIIEFDMPEEAEKHFNTNCGA